ncbi:VCBS repeat-containing protein [Actinoallomurus purpureus]|uniref:VCBS repeat-containing protein n=1 Tax=Actinoallomurus purpureus TaxID=478114 RepID=UPI0020937783|nr:VCBS repeat-containing protein [Actinoallomurus purpureus]MCO6007028.1 VCBS repeat-containing protein [Actinoallomurus purpureus]
MESTSGTANIQIVPTGRNGTLNVTAVAADGTDSPKITEKFIGISNPPAADQDIDGDGKPDLVTIGDTPGLPSGLWLASGASGGRIRIPAKDIGALGAGFNTEPNPADFNGGQVVVGNYFGDGFQDFIVYFTSGLESGTAVLLGGSGDGSTLEPVSGNQQNVGDGLTDYNGDNPLAFANAYNSMGSNGSGDDLIAISGDATNGYYLNYYECRSFGGIYAPQFRISTNTPDGTPDWQNWRMTTTRVASGTAMYLWKPSTGDLYLWESLTTHDNGDTTGTITYTQYKIAENWNTGATFSTFQAADFATNGTPGLWTATPAGVATAYTVSDLSTTPNIHAGAPQTLSPAN